MGGRCFRLCASLALWVLSAADGVPIKAAWCVLVQEDSETVSAPLRYRHVRNKNLYAGRRSRRGGIPGFRRNNGKACCVDQPKRASEDAAGSRGGWLYDIDGQGA